MFTTEDHEFIDFLFGKLTCLTDTEMIDLQDDDSCDDHIQFQQLEIAVWCDIIRDVVMPESTMTFEKNVALNVHELGVILSALQLLDHSDEHHIAKRYGSAPSLYNRLKEIYDNMDSSICDIQHDPICEPSF